MSHTGVDRDVRILVKTPGGEKTEGELEKLTYLDLSVTGITDAGLKDVAKLQKLISLGLENTQITDGGVAELKKALPNCYISSDHKK